MWKVTAQSDSEAEILLYDEIADFDSENWGFVSAKGLINKIKALGKVSDITLRINSIGGDVFEAQAMYNYLRAHPANITVRIDGLAASAASVVAMAGNKIIMPSNSLMMIHNPSGGVWGEADDMRDTAEILDKVRDAIANVYVARTGLDREKVISLMDSETWLTATEAHDLKFCDEVDENVTAVAMAVRGGIIFQNRFGFARVDEKLSEKMPENTVTLRPAARIETQTKENKTEMDIKPAIFTIENVTDLERQYPQLVEEIRNTANEAGYNRGVQSERERLRTLDSLNEQGREALIYKAKYEDPKDARDIAIELLQADKVQAQLKALHQDAQAVNAALPPQRDTLSGSMDDEESAIDAVVNEINRMRGYK